MGIFLKYIGLSFGRIFESYYIPFCIGIGCFMLFHNVIDKSVGIRIPFLSKTTMSESVERFGQLVLGAEEVTETKLMFLYLILICIFLVGTATALSPTAGVIGGGIVLCILEYLLIKYFVPEEGQTTIFAQFGIVIERIVDFEDLRIILENLCLTHYCIEPGMNPCKMARDCINGHELEGRLMQNMIEYIGATTEDYHSGAGLAGEYVDKIGPRETKFTHGYYGYDVGPDPRLQPVETKQNLHGEEPFGGDMLYMGIGGTIVYGLCTLIGNAIILY